MKNPHNDLRIAIGEELRRRVFPDMFEDDLAVRNTLPLCVEEGEMTMRGIAVDPRDLANIVSTAWSVEVGGRACVVRTDVVAMVAIITEDRRYRCKVRLRWSVR